MLEATRSIIVGLPASRLLWKVVEMIWELEINLGAILFLCLAFYLNIRINIYTYKNVNQLLKLLKFPFLTRVSLTIFVVIVVSTVVSHWAISLLKDTR